MDAPLNYSCILTDASIDLALYIVSKFPQKPREEPTQYRTHQEACCCDTCRVKSVCADSGHECDAFRAFVVSGKWKGELVALGLR